MDLCRLGGYCTEVYDVLVSVNGWTDVLMPEIEDVQRVQNELLGEPPPDGAPSTPGGSPYFGFTSEVQSGMANPYDEVDLNLEDQRDLDDELDAEQAIAMASAHARRRARGGRPAEGFVDDDVEGENYRDVVAETACYVEADDWSTELEHEELVGSLESADHAVFDARGSGCNDNDL